MPSSLALSADLLCGLCEFEPKAAGMGVCGECWALVRGERSRPARRRRRKCPCGNGPLHTLCQAEAKTVRRHAPP